MLSRLLTCLLLATVLPAAGCGDEGLQCKVGVPMVHTDLYFGFSRVHVGQAPVSQMEWTQFVDTVITPAFAEGLTMFDASGQFQQMTGITKEDSRLVVLLHDGSAENSARIDAIREKYKSMFSQEAVLRIDDEECVAF